MWEEYLGGAILVGIKGANPSKAAALAVKSRLEISPGVGIQELRGANAAFTWQVSH